MKISKKTIIKLCIIVPILALILFCVLWFNQKPNFSKYHSYAVITDNGDIPLTDEQFQRIVDAYKNDETLYYEWFEYFGGGYDIRLYKTTDMSGEYDMMYTGVTAGEIFLMIGKEKNNGYWSWKAWGYKQDTARQVHAIIEEAIEQYEREQEK